MEFLYILAMFVSSFRTILERVCTAFMHPSHVDMLSEAVADHVLAGSLRYCLSRGHNDKIHVCYR